MRPGNSARKESKKRLVIDDEMEYPVNNTKVNLPILENASFTEMVSWIFSCHKIIIQPQFWVCFANGKLRKVLGTFILNRHCLKISENPFTLTVQFKCTMSDDISDDKFMRSNKNWPQIQVSLFDKQWAPWETFPDQLAHGRGRVIGCY